MFNFKAIWKNYEGNPCMSDVTSKLRQTCDGQRNCEVPLDWHVLGDPCPGRRKEMELTFKCF